VCVDTLSGGKRDFWYFFRCNICFSSRSSCPVAFSGDKSSKAIYSNIPRKSFSACDDITTLKIISHNLSEYQQKHFGHLWFVPLSYLHTLFPVLHEGLLFQAYLCLWAFFLEFSLQREVLSVR